MNVAVLGTLAARSEAEATDDLQTVLEDQVFDSYKALLDDNVIREVFGG